MITRLFVLNKHILNRFYIIRGIVYFSVSWWQISHINNFREMSPEWPLSTFEYLDSRTFCQSLNLHTPFYRSYPKRKDSSGSVNFPSFLHDSPTWLFCARLDLTVIYTTNTGIKRCRLPVWCMLFPFLTSDAIHIHEFLSYKYIGYYKGTITKARISHIRVYLRKS